VFGRRSLESSEILRTCSGMLLGFDALEELGGLVTTWPATADQNPQAGTGRRGYTCRKPSERWPELPGRLRDGIPVAARTFAALVATRLPAVDRVSGASRGKRRHSVTGGSFVAHQSATLVAQRNPSRRRPACPARQPLAKAFLPCCHGVLFLLMLFVRLPATVSQPAQLLQRIKPRTCWQVASILRGLQAAAANTVRPTRQLEVQRRDAVTAERRAFPPATPSRFLPGCRHAPAQMHYSFRPWPVGTSSPTICVTEPAAHVRAAWRAAVT